MRNDVCESVGGHCILGPQVNPLSLINLGGDLDVGNSMVPIQCYEYILKIKELLLLSVANLTCKSIVGAGYRGERLIKSSSSWLLPKFPSG